MSDFKDGYIKAAEISLVKAGQFYDDVATAYLKKYGYNTPWNGDLDDGQDMASDVDGDEDVNVLGTEEAERRSVYYNLIREKIAIWLRTNAGGGLKRKNGRPTFKKLFDKPHLDPPAPVRARTLHFYSRRYYAERIKTRFDARWAAVSKLAKHQAAITVHNAVIKEAWAGESAPFQAEVMAALEAEHKAAMEAHATAVSGEAPTKPEEYQIALDNMGYYLQPFINAVQERFGMNVSLLLCGPVPNRGRAIEMHSVHAGTSKGMMPRIWAAFDHAGFEDARRSFRAFSEQCFSTEERRARALEGVAEGSGVTEDGGSGSGAPVPAPTPALASGSGGGGSAAGGGAEGEHTGEGGGGDGLGDDDHKEEEEEEEEPVRVRCEYEIGRDQRIARNKAMLAELGLGGGVRGTYGEEGWDVGWEGEGCGHFEEEEEGDEEEEQEEQEKQEEQEEQEEEEVVITRPKPRPLPKRVPLVQPEDMPASAGPLRQGVPRPGVDVLLVRPEDDAVSEGPLRDVLAIGGGADVPLIRPKDDAVSEGGDTDVPLVRPEDDAASEGPLRNVVATGGGADIPLVRPEDDVASEGPSNVWVAQVGWSEELQNVVGGFERLKGWGSGDWAECIALLL
ncbi:hypothetical protein DFH09DRAFT_1307546 [Mycena vulgaris]|nr:hypothetical protein DFH09DRAFT_1307546 [Mycena vulgaris]